MLPDLVPERNITQKSVSSSTGSHLSPRQCASSQSGAALIFVLAMLVLILTVVLAFFSRATLNSQIAASSAKNTKGLLLTQTAEAYLLDDFQREIAAGSTTLSPTNLTVQIRRPITLTNAGVGVTNTYAPSMVPQRVGGAGATNIVKVSRSGLAFFTNGPGYTTTGLARASAISTTTPSANGRSLTKDRWNKPRLMTDSEAAAFVPPDWIYIDRQGSNLTSFSPMADLASVTNNKYVIARYAYVVYDVGGLIDINVVGNQLDATNNSRRGRLNQVSLTNGIPGITDFASLVNWRSTNSSTNASSTSGGGGLFDPKRTFIDVPTGEQAFVNRQDLIAYVASTNTISNSSLPFLTTFSRDLNAPSYEPNSARPMLPASPDPNAMNPGLLTNRFAAVTTLNRPEGAITVRSGTPVMPRRFPLSKLSLFEQASPDPVAMSYYFGLTKVDSQTWRYTATTSDGRIARLSEVAALGREPNFFEILQAVIITGSLGKSGDDTYTYDKTRDSLRNLQVIQIGANIIDQWDANDFPTCIQFPSGLLGQYLSSYGVENLPYISQIGVAGWHPSDKKEMFQAWAIFDVWNPHQIATNTPNNIENFRIKPVSGQGYVAIYYSLSDSACSTPNAVFTKKRPNNPLKLDDYGGTLYQETQADIGALNAGREFIFPATNTYTEPTTLGVIPNSYKDTPGVLLAECSPLSSVPYNSKAIPPAGERESYVQITINSVMDIVSPYIAYTPPLPGQPTNLVTPVIDANGRRVYPTGTAFTGTNASISYPDSTYWLQEGPDNLTISGKYGVKAHNVFRLKGNGIPSQWIFDLQYKTGTNWYTYQQVEGLGYQQCDVANSPIGNDTRANILKDTYNPAILKDEFYTWRGRGSSVGMIKVDPRSNRLGLSGWSQTVAANPGNDFLGNSIRNLTSSLPSNFLSDTGGNTLNGSLDWCFPNGISVGRTAPKVLDLTFNVMPEFMCPPQKNRFQIGLYGLVANNPDFLNSANPARYSDPDGVIRPGDGYFGSLPTARGQIADRPLLLNRPFRSVGELGYVFRDIPWKTLDFSTRRSGDLGLLDVFSLSETDGDPPLTAGQINLNTRQTAALAAALQNSSRQPGVFTNVISTNQATTIAAAIVAESTARPFADKGDLVTRVLNSGGTDPLAGDSSKVAREAAVRTLGEIGTTRTWNFMIDLVVQTGRFTSSSSSGSAFMVQGEERAWIHVAIDRITGEVLEIRREVVNE